MKRWAAAAAVGLALACGGADPIVPTGGDAKRGREHVAAYQCGVCHVVPGIRGARGVVGPPLTGFGLRSFIGGQLPNTPENLVRWIQDPPALVPGTAMPAIGLSEQEARDVAAFLYELR